mmetsp:Transcript_15940/g.53592  ORF Transcript_15940/g.53592 Transcript_15940/m.53592 type:complete len:140 (-) Transcript_15940:715-1134(-)
MAYVALGGHDMALELFEASLVTFQETDNVGGPWYCDLRLQLGLCREALGKLPAAIDDLIDARDRLERENLTHRSLYCEVVGHLVRLGLPAAAVWEGAGGQAAARHMRRAHTQPFNTPAPVQGPEAQLDAAPSPAKRMRT